MRFPDAAAIEITSFETDPITEDVEEVHQTRYGSDFEQPEDTVVIYSEGDEYHRFDFVRPPEEIGGQITGHTEDGGQVVVIRALTPDDAIDLSPAGVPQPVDAVEAHVIRGGGMLAGELDAAVAPDNTVVTLVLDTGVGLYVRYSGDWQLLPEDSSSLENAAIHPVEAAAVDVFDTADAAGRSLTIFDLPRSVDNTYTDVEDREEEAPTGGPVIASIDNITDLTNRALMTPVEGEQAWYVRKRMKALAASGMPDPQVITAAGDLIRALQDGVDPDPAGLVRRDIIRRARAAGMLSHPVIVAAINWREWLHPRGRDGKFIHKAGWVNIFDSLTPSPMDKPRRGKVRELSPRGIVVDVVDPQNGNKPTGEQITVNPKLIEDFRSVGTLGGPAKGGEGSSAGALTARFRNAFDNLTQDIPYASANTSTDERLTDEALVEHYQFLDAVNEKIDTQGLSLERLMKDPQGRWEDEFYEWMLDVADEVYDSKYADRPKDRKAMITGGLGGAGKSTTLERLGAAGVINPSEWVTINPDDMKEEMIARGMFPVVVGMAPAEMANILHGVSAEMAHLLSERALAEGNNVIFDITLGGGLHRQADGSWSSRANEVVNDILSAGYSDIDGIFVDIPVDRSVQQAMKRHREGLERLRAGVSGEGGRYVPERIIRSNEYNPGPDGQPNPLGFGLERWIAGKKIATPYEDRYGTEEFQRSLAAKAEDVRAAMFDVTPGNEETVDRLLEEFTAAASLSGIERASTEQDMLTREWEFLDPRIHDVAPSERFSSVNAYNFAKATHEGAITGDWAMFDNTDLDNQKTITATGKFEGVQLSPVRRSGQNGPMLDGLGEDSDPDWVMNIMAGLESGSHELTSHPTSENYGKFMLHVSTVHSDEVDHTQWIEYDTEEARDAALDQARSLQERSFARRAQKVSAFEGEDPEITALANGLVDPGPRGTRQEALRSRVEMAKRLETVKMPDGSWALRDTLTGTTVGDSGERDDVAARRARILNTLYPPLNA